MKTNEAVTPPTPAQIAYAFRAGVAVDPLLLAMYNDNGEACYLLRRMLQVAEAAS